MKKIILFKLLVLILLVANISVSAASISSPEPPSTKPSKFTDISGHWAAAVIEKMAETGIVSGMGNNKFAPNEKMTRSQFASILHRALDIHIAYFAATDITKTFDDVKNEDWYASNLVDLVTSNIVDDKLHFRPNDAITREEMVHYLMKGYRYKLQIPEDFNKNLVFTTFEDDKDINPSFKKDVKMAADLKLVLGRENNMFMPKATSTRAEVAVVIDRMINAINSFTNDVKVEPKFEAVKDGYVMQLTITNNSSSQVSFNTGGQKYDFVLLDGDRKELYRWSEGKFFTMQYETVSLEAGKSIEYSAVLDSKTYQQIVDKAVYMKAYIVGSSENFKINQDGYELKIKEANQTVGVKVEPGYEKTADIFKMKLSIANNSDKSIAISLSSGQKYDFVLLDSDRKELYRWSSGKFFTLALMNATIEPGKTMEFSESLDLKTYKDIVDKAVYLKAYIAGSSDDFEINPEGYEIKLK